MKSLFFSFVIPLLLIVKPLPVMGNEIPKVYVEVILDASGSMAGKVEGRRKMDIAKEIVRDIVNEVFSEEREDLEFALRVYGHRSPKDLKDCKDSALEHPFGKLNVKQLNDILSGLKPVGYTPIAYSLTQAANDFPIKDEKIRKMVILITDGIESCEDSPCKAAQKLMDAKAFTSIHVIGFGLKEQSLSLLECITKSSGGMLLGAQNALELKKTFKKAISEAVNAGFRIQVTVNDALTSEATIALIPSGAKAPIRIRSADLEGQEVIYVPPGTYDIAVREHTTEVVQRTEGVSGKVGELVDKKVNFLRGGLLVKVSVDGKPTTEADINIYRSGENKLARKRRPQPNGEETVFLPIDTFDIQVIERTTEADNWWRGVKVEQGKILEKRFDFVRSGFQVKATINGVITPEARFDIFHPGETVPKRQVQAQVEQPQYIYLPAGTYDIKALAFGIKNVQWKRGVKIEPGEVKPLDFNLLASGLMLGVTLNGELTGDANIEIYNTGGTSPIKKVRASYTGKKQIILPEGQYDLRVVEFSTRQEKWRKGLILQEGKVSEINFDFLKNK